MSTAVLISGQMRSFAQCYPTQRFQIFRHYEPDIHFFVSCCDDAQADSAELLRQDYKNVRIENWKDPDHVPEIPVEFGSHAPYANAAGHRQLMLQHWGNQRAWEFFINILLTDNYKNLTDFDTIIRIRPDQWMHRFQAPPTPLSTECYCPWWGKFGGVNDRLAIMGTSAARWYFRTLDNIAALLDQGCPFHPETLVRESMRLGRVSVQNTLLAEFSTLRLGGKQRWPEITFSDIVEFVAATK